MSRTVRAAGREEDGDEMEGDKSSASHDARSYPMKSSESSLIEAEVGSHGEMKSIRIRSAKNEEV